MKEVDLVHAWLCAPATHPELCLQPSQYLGLFLREMQFMHNMPSLIPRLLLTMQKSRGRRSLGTRLGYACTMYQ